MKRSPNLSRRRFVGTVATALLAGRTVLAAAVSADEARRERVRGLLLGSFLGDALGGPVEFQEPAAVQRLPDPPHQWTDDEVLNAATIAATAARLRLRDYAALRPTPEPYAHWVARAPAGTVTDDSRHKLILLAALHAAQRDGVEPLGAATLAQAYLDWPDSLTVQRDAVTRELCAAWLEEWKLGARWVLGDRDGARARPPERMWGGLPTCCGQMTSLPLAALHPGEPKAAYRQAFAVGFFDNGFGKDLNAAIVAGLAAALAQPRDAAAATGAAWRAVVATMRATDPFGYGQVPWVKRSVDRWLDFAIGAVAAADGRPARVGAALEETFRDTIKWEAQVPFTVAVAALELFPRDPLAALQWSIEWGHDTDSYAQLAGAFIGAMHGAEIFPAPMLATVGERIRVDYNVDLDAEADWLASLGTSGEP